MKSFIAVMLAILLAGCAAMQTGDQAAIPTIPEVTGKDVETALRLLVSADQDYLDALKRLDGISGDLVKVALLEVGLFKEALGADIHNLPAEAMEILQRYEELALKAQADGTLGQYERGQLYGMRLRFRYKVVVAAIQVLGPQVLRFLSGL